MVTFAADYPFVDVLWTMIIFFVWVVWIWMMVALLSDQRIRTVARTDGNGDGAATEIEKAEQLLARGTLTQAEFQTLKSKALAH